MKLYRIYNSDGDTMVREVTPEEVLEDMKADESDGSEFLKELPGEASTNNWPEGSVLLIRGTIIKPKAAKVIEKWELP